MLYFFCFPVALYAQTYQQLSERAIDCIERQSSTSGRTFARALKLEPKNAKNALLFSNLGLVQRRLGEFDKALRILFFCLELCSIGSSYFVGPCRHLYGNGERQIALILIIARCLTGDKQNKEALLMRAYIYVLRRDYPAARNDYNRLLELDPQSYSGRLGLATLEQKEGKFREALAILNKMIVEYPEDATLYIARADVERDMKHEDLALVDLEEAIRLDASSADAYLLRGNIYLVQKKRHWQNRTLRKPFRWGVPPADLHEQLKQCR